VNALDGGHLVGRYRIVKFLGAGAMGEVYLADDPQIDRRLAIKTVRLVGRPQEIEDRKKRLLREARAAGRLLHPNVVTLFDAGEAEGMLYLAFEYVEGTDLAQRLEAGEQRLSLRQVLRVVRQVADALDYAHGQGIVHRDIKPSNILLDTFGRVKVADFGIAKMAGQSTELTMAGSVMGSPQYLSPEQIRGEDLDGRSDIFSLGVVLYEILSGKRPFEGETITTLVYQILHKDPPPVSELRAVPPRLEELLRRMLAKSAGDRLATGGEAARELAAIEAELSDETLSAPAGAEELDATRILPRKPTPVGGVAAAAPSPLGTVPASPGTTPSVRASTVAASLPTASQPVAQVAPPPQAAPPAAPVPSLVAAAASRKPLPIGLLIGVVLLVIVGALGVGGWMFWRSRQAGAEATAQTAQGQPGTSGTQTAASVGPPPVPAAAAPSLSSAAPTPSVMPPAPAPVTPMVSSAPAANVPRQVPPPPAAPAPRTSPPANVPPAMQERPVPRSQTPERVSVPAPAPAPAAPEREAEPAPVPAASSTGVDRSMRTGMEVTFNVQPEDAHVLVDGRVIGEAQDWNGQRGARTFVFGDAGSHLIKIRKPGLKEYRIAVEAGAVGGKTPITARLQSMVAEEVDASDLQTVRVREAVAFRLQPPSPTAEVRVDGQPVGLARRFGGGGFLRAKEWLELAPGKHRISIVSPGFRRKDILVEVVATAERDRERIDVAMTAGGSGE
jgi:serine/threonine-protein kinase